MLIEIKIIVVSMDRLAAPALPTESTLPTEMEFTVMMGRTMCLALFAAGLAGLFETADAADWMFRRSYFSHVADFDNPYDGPPSREIYRQAVVAAPSAVRSGWRINSFVLHNGSSSDTTYYRENWTDVSY